jgi:hypothetical protein
LKTAYISGWALDRGARWRFNTDHAFPLSDHAGYDDLMAYVGMTGAQTIYTMHGFEDEFARDLREQGLPGAAAEARGGGVICLRQLPAK